MYTQPHQPPDNKLVRCSRLQELAYLIKTGLESIDNTWIFNVSNMPLTDMCLIIIEQSVAYLLVKESCITIKTLHHHIDETIPDTRIPASSNGITFDLRIPTLFNDILTTLHQFETQYRKSPNYIEINEQE